MVRRSRTGELGLAIKRGEGARAGVRGRERGQERELAWARELERTAPSAAGRGGHLSGKGARAMEREQGEATTRRGA